MNFAQLRQADLNLLVVLAVMAEERNVSRAADRLSLSQPAVTRALQRLRATFRDDLLVRVSGDYEPTPKGQRLLQELEAILPRLDRLLAGVDFNPAVEEARFRLVGTDYATQVVCLPLCRRILEAGHKVSLDVSPLNDVVFDAMERGRVDLALLADDGRSPHKFIKEEIFREEFVCVVAGESPYSGRITLEEYLDAVHIGVATFEGIQTIPEKQLAAVGTRRCAFRVPYFSMAIRGVAGTKLIATVPGRIAAYEVKDRDLKIVRAPEVFGKFKYLMVWHPRMHSDSAHAWLRSMIREIGESL